MNEETRTPCDATEERLSALLDGELPPGAAAEALEHAFGCASCRRFFLSAKRLQAVAPELAAAPVPAADPVWERIRVASGISAPAARIAPARWGGFSIGPRLRAAAFVALGLGAGYLLAPFARGEAPGSGLSGGAVVAASARSDAGAMDERRFVALAQELLAADPKFQRTMLQVLRLVPALETGEGLDEPEDRGFVRANAEEERRARGSV
jgi:hypothetical protein